MSANANPLRDDPVLVEAAKELIAMPSPERAEALLEEHGDALANWNYGDGVTPLMRFVVGRRENLMAVMLRHGASASVAADTGMTALHRAAGMKGGIATICSTLLQHGADPNAVEHDRLRTPLHFAALNDCGPEATVLLNAGADINARDNEGRTPALAAVDAGCAEVLAVLLDEGADPNDGHPLRRVPWSDWRSPRRSKVAAVHALLEHGATLDSSEDLRAGAYALGEALEEGREDTVRLLRAVAARATGADPVSVDDFFEIARTQDDDAMTARLIQQGVVASCALRRAVALGPEAVAKALQSGDVAPADVRRLFLLEAAELVAAPRAAVTTRALMAWLGPDASREAVAEAWPRAATDVVRCPGVLAAFLGAGADANADCVDGRPLQQVVRRRDHAFLPAAVNQLLRAGAQVDPYRGHPTILALFAAPKSVGVRGGALTPGGDLAEAARALLAAGSDADAVRSADGRSAISVMMQWRPEALPLFAEAARPRVAAVRDAVLGATGDRDSTRLVLAFFSTLAPLGVPLGELADVDTLRRLSTKGRVVLRARRRRR